MSEEKDNIEKRVDEKWKEFAKEEAKPSPEESNLPFEVDFSNFVTSLGLQAMIFLGEIANPVSQKKEENIPQAKFIIDTLLMLREKTKGNLKEDETNLLNNFIYELQMKFVEKNKEIKQ
ncbi:MAG: DUF1844 domain-containing protein [Candidatus Omnitrophota bacterium]|nr:DUF1844 domain-containing protein [Candidatus Omnitrophota bacterium]